VGALYQSMALAFSAQNSVGFLRDFSHSCLRFCPLPTWALAGLYFSLKGKLDSDISIIPLDVWVETLSSECIKLFGFAVAKGK